MTFALILHHIDAAVSLLALDVERIHDVTVTWSSGRL